MLKMFACGLVAAALSCSMAARASVLPGLPGSASGENAYSAVEDARVFCFNRGTGRFLHWGSCYRSVPRIYCRNRWTGAFLHWGSCF